MMDQREFARIGAIFQQAVLLRGRDRQDYLERACGGDRELRREVESLLDADMREDSRLAQALGGPLIDSLDPAEVATLLDQKPVDQKRVDQKPVDQKRVDQKQKRYSPSGRSSSMQQIQCSRGHFYDPEEHISCPHCPVAGLTDLSGATMPVAPSRPAQNFGGSTSPAPDGPTRGLKNLDEGLTVGVLKAKIGVEPVVGWLVCIEGPDRGRDYRIRAQRNFIGRDIRMDICIAGDDQVSKDNHATLIYDPRSNGFRLAPGDAHGITYLNNESVDVPMPLKAYDLIEVGATKLLFVPFCGEAFQWQ